METKEVYRGRLIDHLHLVVRDVEAVFHGPAKRSTDAVKFSWD